VRNKDGGSYTALASDQALRGSLLPVGRRALWLLLEGWGDLKIIVEIFSTIPSNNDLKCL